MLVWLSMAAPHVAIAQPDRWLFLPVSAGEGARGVAAGTLVEPFEADFGQDQVVLASADAATIFAGYSSEPIRLSEAQVQRLQQRLKQSTDDLALGEGGAAERMLRELRGKPADREALSRDARGARELWQLCLTQAHVMQRARKLSAAEQQVRECIRWFPGFKLERDYPPALRKLVAAALNELQSAPHASLSITSKSSSACGVRLNGVHVGETPLRLPELELGPANVQLACGATEAGRVHALELVDGENRLEIDPEFDASVRVDAALALHYTDVAQRERRMRSDTDAVAAVLRVGRIVLVLQEPDKEGARISLRTSTEPTKAIASLTYTQARGYDRTALREAIATLRKSVGLESAPRREVLVPARLASDPLETEGEGAPVLEPREGEDSPDVLRLALAITASTLGTVALVTSWVVYGSRRDYASQSFGNAIGFDQVHEFESRGTQAVVFGASAAVLLSASVYLWTPPEQDGVPTWAWVIGGLGVGAAAVGLGFVLFGDHCELEAPGARRAEAPPCRGFAADSLFGPLVMLNAVPLLMVPVSSALQSSSASTPARAALQVGPAGLSLRGAF